MGLNWTKVDYPAVDTVAKLAGVSALYNEVREKYELSVKTEKPHNSCSRTCQ